MDSCMARCMSCWNWLVRLNPTLRSNSLSTVEPDGGGGLALFLLVFFAASPRAHAATRTFDNAAADVAEEEKGFAGDVIDTDVKGALEADFVAAFGDGLMGGSLVAR